MHKKPADKPAAPVVESKESPPKTAYPITLDITPRSLPVKLTELEIISKCRDLASVIQEIADEEVNQKALKDDMKAKLSRLDDRKLMLSHVVTKGEEYRPIDVQIIVDEHDHVNEVRTDTGEVVTSRQAKDSERQLALIRFKETQEKAAGESGGSGAVADRDITPENEGEE